MKTKDENPLEQKDTLSRQARLRSAFDAVAENAQRHYGYCLSGEISAAVEDRLRLGDDYWRGWVNKPGLTVGEFVQLLATHVLAEQFYDCQLTGGCPCDPMHPGCHICEPFYFATEDALISTLRDAQLFMRSLGAPLFVGDVTNLAENELNPRETLELLMAMPASPEGGTLLPRSLRVWWFNQSNKKTVTAETEPLTTEKPRVGYKEIGNLMGVTAETEPLTTEKPLVGYKEIGKFLGVTAETVEKSYKAAGAPIRKDMATGRVWALPSELLHWKAARSKKNIKRKSSE